MLFRKDIAKSCAYCRYGVRLSDLDILCSKKGIVTAENSCHRFSYDPFKRIPPKAKASDLSKYDDEDFSL